jgi:hypothetical protein
MCFEVWKAVTSKVKETKKGLKRKRVNLLCALWSHPHPVGERATSRKQDARSPCLHVFASVLD